MKPIKTMIRGKFTYRNPLWNSFIKFLGDFKDYPPFEKIDNGKHKNSLEQVYERALNKMMLDNSDFTTIALKFVFLGEHDLDSDMIEYMAECGNMGRKCYTTEDGEKIIKEAEIIVNKRRQDNEHKDKLEKAREKLAEAERKRQAFFDEQNRINSDWEDAKYDVEVLENAVPNYEPKQEVKEDIIDEVDDIEDVTDEPQQDGEFEETKENETDSAGEETEEAEVDNE